MTRSSHGWRLQSLCRADRRDCLGARASRGLECPGEDLALPALQVLEHVSSGHPDDIGDEVVAPGGGNTAMAGGDGVSGADLAVRALAAGKLGPSQSISTWVAVRLTATRTTTCQLRQTWDLARCSSVALAAAPPRSR